MRQIKTNKVKNEIQFLYIQFQYVNDSSTLLTTYNKVNFTHQAAFWNKYLTVTM